MLVTFEGIDGAGKSTVTRHVVSLLEQDGVTACVLGRNSFQVHDATAARHIELLQHLIWPQSADEPQYILGDRYFLHLLGAWFTVFDKHVIGPALQQHQVVILDGWFYKALARHSLRSHLSNQAVASAFEGLSSPDLFFLLSIDPHVAAERKLTFSNAEAGVNDGFGGGRSGFLRYQSIVGTRLQRIAKEHDKYLILDAAKPAYVVASEAHAALMRLTSR